MPTVTLFGAGSTMFARRLIADCMHTPALRDSHFALYDIDASRLSDSVEVAPVYNEGASGFSGGSSIDECPMSSSKKGSSKPFV